MKNKKAFTLIELLAVIVVLSVVVAITVPVVSKSIENSKKNSAIESANGLIQSAEYYFLTASPKYGKIDVLNEKLNFKGEKPDFGEVEINKQGKSRIYTYVNGYCVTKEFGTELYANKTTKEDCSWFGTDNYETTDGTTFTLNNQSVKNYLIYGNSTQATRIGKNLFNPSAWSTAVTGGGLTVQYLEDQDCFLINGTATATTIVAAKYINIPSEVNTSYVLSTQYVSGSIDRTNGESSKYAVAYFGNGDEINTANNWYEINMQNSDVNNSAKINSKSYITRFWFYVNKGVKFNNYKVRIQLEKGTTATSYEEYGVMPSPAFPSEVKSTGDLLTSSNCSSYGSDACNNVGKYVIQVKDRGKNLFDHSYLKQQDSSGGLTMTSTGDVITINGKLTNPSNIKLSDVFPNIFDVNKTYTLKIDVVGGSGAIGEGTGITFAFSLFNSSNTKYIRTNVNATALDNIASVTFSGSVFAGEEKLHLLLQNWRLGNTYSNYQVRIQIEEGSSATSYESYKAALTNIYLDEPLRKVGDYADYIDFNNKKVVRNVSKKVFNGTDNDVYWGKNIDYGDYVSFYTTSDVKTFKGINGLGYSNVAKVTSWDKISNSNGNYWWQFLPTSYGMRINKSYLSNYDSATDKIGVFKTWLKSNNIEVVQALNTPTEQSINLPEIEVLDGNSTLLINTSVQPSNIKLTTNK